MALLTFERVSRYYPNGQGVGPLSFALGAGQRYGLLGLNGSGKTTTLKLMAGLLQPDSGQIRFEEGRLYSQRRQIGLLRDGANFPGWMTPRDIQNFLQGAYPDFRLSIYQELLQNLKVPEQTYDTMSKGERQRCGLAATLARDVSLYVLDEPLSGIDMVSRQKILDVLTEHDQKGGTIVFSTHEIREIESLLDGVLILRRGELLAHHTRAELAEGGHSIADEFIRLHDE
jgi:ABC-2 type transport system ATP-binding protein